VVNPSQLYYKPKSVSFEVAASSPVVALTAIAALIEISHIKEGQRVLIIGASGGTGSYCVKLAKHYKCYVAATCSARNAEFVSSIGADKVIDYNTEDFATVLKGEKFDIVVDCHV